MTSASVQPLPDDDPSPTQLMRGVNYATDVRSYFEARVPAMLESIKALVEIESPSVDVEALNKAASFVAERVAELCGDCDIEWNFAEDGRPHLIVRFGERTDVLLIGHFDTVHPIGTLEKHPWNIKGDRAYGPGILDMKSGVVIMMEIARCILRNDPRPNLTLFINSDEELGSPTSVPVLRRAAEGASIALAFESTVHEGLLKIGLRGMRRFIITLTGKGGHAAYPEHNINPVDSLADVILHVRKLNDPANGIVVTPTTVSGAEAGNVVPNEAVVVLDVRGDTEAKLENVELQLKRLSVADPRVTVNVERTIKFETFEVRDNNRAFAFAKEAGRLLGIPSVSGVEARGGGDLNNLANIVPDGLEGLGGWGDGLHDPTREHVMISSLPSSAALGTLITQMALDDTK